MTEALEVKQNDQDERWNLTDCQTIDDYPLTEAQKEIALTYAVRLIGRIYGDQLWLDWNSHCKSYDPLIIADHKAHSYLMNLEDGGRHHPYTTLAHLEKMIVDELRKECAENIGAHYELRDEPKWE